MCENILCFRWFHTPIPLKLLTSTLPWFTLTGFNHAWLSHTLNQAVSTLIVCYYPSCISIRDALPPSPPPPSRHALDVVLPLCAATRWEKKGEPLKCVVTAVQINSKDDAPWVCRLPSLVPFHPHTLLLSSEQWPEELNKGGEATGQPRSGWRVPLKAAGQHGPLVPQTPPALCAS